MGNSNDDVWCFGSGSKAQHTTTTYILGKPGILLYKDVKSMKYKCGFLANDAMEYDHIETDVSGLAYKWLKLYNELFEDRPSTKLAIWPTTLGIFSLERIE